MIVWNTTVFFWRGREENAKSRRRHGIVSKERLKCSFGEDLNNIVYRADEFKRYSVLGAMDFLYCCCRAC